MNIRKIVILLMFLVAIVGIMAPVNAAIESVQSENKDIILESKQKTINYKITWNANGGKIGSKKTLDTSVKMGSKIEKLPVTPKRSGYAFQGWYTKKTGGKKINKDTRPVKSVTYYAQWKKAKTLNSDEKKLVGTWELAFNSAGQSGSWKFNEDGTFTYNRTDSSSGGNLKPKHEYKGVYSINNRVLSIQGQKRSDYGSGWQSWEHVSSFYGVEFGTDSGRQYVLLDYKNWGYGEIFYKT